MTSAERNREMGVINLVTPEKQRQIDEIKDNLVKLHIPEELRNKMLNEIDSFLKIWPQSIDWFDMPQEMRELVIEEMDIKTKCKFTQCSKKCEEEVKTSKKFLTRIKLSRWIHPQIHIRLARQYRYYLEFMDVSDVSEPKTKVVYKTRLLDEKWTKIEDGRVEEVRMKYFNEYINKSAKTIERFDIDDKKFQCSNFDWKQLKNLNGFVSYYQDVRVIGLMELSQINKINKCYLPETEFTFEEILQLEGSFYRIKSNDFNEEHFEKYLKMLKNGEVHRNMETLTVCFDDDREDVNRERLVKNLDAFDFHEYDYSFEFQFRFLLNYERKSKCYCQVRYFSRVVGIEIISDDYDEVMKNRQPLDF